MAANRCVLPYSRASGVLNRSGPRYTGCKIKIKTDAANKLLKFQFNENFTFVSATAILN